MGDPIVFVPGLLCTEALYAPQIAAFADRPLMVANHRDQDSIESIAASILEKAPERFSLVGLSMGGYLAMEILREAPERVSRVALLDTNARADTAEQTGRREFMIKLTRKKSFKMIPDLLFPGFVHEKRKTDKDLKSIVVEMANDTGPDAFIRQQTALINRPDARPQLPDVICPALVVVGDGDRLTPLEMSQEIHELISGSELAVIPGSGHLSTLEEPEQVTATLHNFLNMR